MFVFIKLRTEFRREKVPVSHKNLKEYLTINKALAHYTVNLDLEGALRHACEVVTQRPSPVLCDPSRRFGTVGIRSELDMPNFEFGPNSDSLLGTNLGRIGASCTTLAWLSAL